MSQNNVVPEPFARFNQNTALRVKARMSRIHDVPKYLCLTDAEVMENGIFTFDPFQARTLAVFESIYRYGRGMLGTEEFVR